LTALGSNSDANNAAGNNNNNENHNGGESKRKRADIVKKGIMLGIFNVCLPDYRSKNITSKGAGCFLGVSVAENV